MKGVSTSAIRTGLQRIDNNMKNFDKMIKEANGVGKIVNVAPKNFEKIASAQANYNKPWVKAKS